MSRRPRSAAYPAKESGIHGATHPVGRMAVHLAGILLVMVLMASVLLLIASGFLKNTIFSPGFFMNTFTQPAYLSGMRANIDDSLNKQAAYVGVPADVLIKGVDDTQVYVLLRKHIENVSEFLNGRAAFSLPTYPADRFAAPLMAYAQELEAAGVLEMTEEQTKLLLAVADDSAKITQDAIDVMNLTTIQNMSLFKTAHRTLYRVSLLDRQAIIMIGTSLLLLLLLFFRRIRRLIGHALTGFWLAGVLTGVPMAVLLVSGFFNRLSISPDHFKGAVIQLLNQATRGLMGAGLILVFITSAGLLANHVWGYRAEKKWLESGVKRSVREKNRQISVSSLE